MSQETWKLINSSHLLGVTPNREREKWLYRMIPLIGLAYRQLRTNKKECMQALEESEMEIIRWLEEI
jgi:hypothetical protein